jgi:hypothetical protein
MNNLLSRIQKATKKKSKLRVLFESASGGGKTLSSLILAKTFGKACVIDTECGSASLYADKFDFDVLELSAPFTPEAYIDAIHEVENAGYDVLIIDSITPEWSGEGGCLDIQNKLGGRYTDWAKVSPRHQKFIDAIIHSPLHVIATCRSKADYKMDENTKKVTKAGTAPQQREGLDFEFTTVFTLNQAHMAEATKDRTSIFDGKEAIVTEKTGQLFIDWLNSGAEPVVKQPEPPKSSFIDEVSKLKTKIGDEKFNQILKDQNIEDWTKIIDRDQQVNFYKELVKL